MSSQGPLAALVQLLICAKQREKSFRHAQTAISRAMSRRFVTMAIPFLVNGEAMVSNQPSVTDPNGNSVYYPFIEPSWHAFGYARDGFKAPSTRTRPAIPTPSPALENAFCASVDWAR